MKLRVFEGFAGYGGAAFGLKKSNIDFEIIGYSEILPKAIELYELNHKNINNYGDITKIDPDDLPDFDLFTGGFPCQAFSTAGLGKGELDTRGTLFYDIIRICEKKQPDHILLENVKGILSRRHKNTFDKIISELNRIGYKVKYKLINTLDYGIPQNRERVWIYATRLDIPENWDLIGPAIPRKNHIKNFLDKSVEDKYYKNQDQVNRLIEITGGNFDVKEPLIFDVYNKKLKTEGICNTLTEPHHNSIRVIEPIINNKFQVRKLTEKEHFRLMGFEDNEIDFGDLSYTQICRAAGNGWDINIVSRIFNNINELINNTCNEFIYQKEIKDFF